MTATNVTDGVRELLLATAVSFAVVPTEVDGGGAGVDGGVTGVDGAAGVAEPYATVKLEAAPESVSPDVIARALAVGQIDQVSGRA